MLRLACLAFIFPVATPALAQPVSGGAHGAFAPTDHVTDAQRAEIWRQIDANRARLITEGRLDPVPASRSVPALAFPLRSATADDDGYYAISNYVDREAGAGLQDFMCNQRTYNGHRGTDLFTWPFPWEKMDGDEVEVIAAAAGTIVFREEGRPDRSCTLNGTQWNAVYVEHADGSIAWYGHLKTDSATPKQVGETVEVGEYLGVVGSSGNSTGPHLHLELYDGMGDLVDPYSGACNGEPSAWADQEPYTVTSILSLQTHSAAPQHGQCPTTVDTPNRANTFGPGDAVFVGSYFRDQFQGQPMLHSVRAPDGALFANWTSSLQQAYFPATWWYWSVELPDDAAAGTWTYRVEFEGEVAERTFTVTPPVATDAPPGAIEAISPRPNPSADGAALTLRLDGARTVTAELYDARGRRVGEVWDGPLGAGEHALPVETARLPAGVYVVRVAAGDYRGSFPLTVAR